MIELNTMTPVNFQEPCVIKFHQEILNKQIYKNAGIMIIPPPMPNRPAKMPENEPNKK